jgi:hypothetical protein
MSITDDCDGQSALLLSGAITLARGFPTLLTLVSPPALPDDAAAALWASTHAETLAAILIQSGVILFRGFPLRSPASFGSFVAAFQWRDLPYEDSLSLAVRLPVCDRVCTTNEGRAGGVVFHHEQAAAPRFPARVFVFCDTPAAPGAGGGTGISPSWVLLERLAAERPDFLAACEARGLQYRLVLPATQDASTGVGRSWRSFFSVDSRDACEARMAALGYTFTWGADDVLELVSPVLPAVRTTPGPRGAETRVFFNQVVAQVIANAADFSAQAGGARGSAPAKPCLTFGDGSAVPGEPVEFAFKVCEENAAEIAWEKGDVALIDNYLAMHARRAWTGDGPRRVLASLTL